MHARTLAPLFLVCATFAQDPAPKPTRQDQQPSSRPSSTAKVAASQPSTTSRPDARAAHAGPRSVVPTTPGSLAGRPPGPTTAGPSGPTSPGPGLGAPAAGVATGSDEFALGRGGSAFSFPGRNDGTNTATFAGLPETSFVAVREHPLSTFSVDVDTAGYAMVRRALTEGKLPPPGAVRIEDLLNYFRYEYPQPKDGEPFSVTLENGTCPWATDHRLVLVGLRGREIEQRVLPPRNLTFLVDVSGSMSPEDRLPLVQRGLRMLSRTLREQDHVAIVVYAGASGLVLPPTSGVEQETIQRAITNLRAGGPTNGTAGITLAYEVARRHFDREGINRVILATDGDFNVGVTNTNELVKLIERERESGVFLTVLGVGTDNLQDARMKQLAKNGNGNYAYLDSLQEAHKVLVREAGATLITIAKDVKLQIEFNPARVQSYRLIGYENRRLRNRDFNDDRKDAGEIGAGHTVTALYEMVPNGACENPEVDALKYQPTPVVVAEPGSTELLTVKLRYKEPDGAKSKLVTRALENVATTDTNLRFASGVAGFGMLLLGSPFRGSTDWPLVKELVASDGRPVSPERVEFGRLVDLAAELQGQAMGVSLRTPRR